MSKKDRAEGARIEATAAGAWQPLPDGLHFIDDAMGNGTHILASLGGTTIEFENESGEPENDRYICLPPDYRLCMRTTPSAPATATSEPVCAGCGLAVEDDPHLIKEWSGINTREYWHTRCFVREHIALARD